MAADEPLRNQDLPPQLREQIPDRPRSERTDQTQPMIGDLVYRPDESSEDAARDAVMQPGDPAGHIEQMGLSKQASDIGARAEGKPPERDDTAANKPPRAADEPSVKGADSAEESVSAAAPNESAKEPVDSAPDAPPTANPSASPVSDEASGDGGSSFAMVDESLPADESPAEPIDDSDDAVSPDSSAVSTPEEPAVSADVPSTTGNSPATAGADALSPAAAGSRPGAPTASPGLAQGQVTSAARSQQREEDLPPRTTELLAPGPDGQPPMARPIVLVRLTDDETHRMVNDALAKLAADSSELMESIAADHVDYIFWQLRAQERAILRFN